jgi:predicted MFS family arabinose efflux permease
VTRSRDAVAVLTASLPFALAGFGILELAIRWTDESYGSSTVKGVVLAAFGLGYGVAQIPSGIITAWLGAARLLRLATVGCLLTWPLVLAPQWPVIALGRLMFGFAAGLTFSAGLMFIRENVSTSRRTVGVAVFGTSWAVGQVFGAVLGHSERACAIFVAVECILALVMLRPRAHREHRGRLWSLPRRRRDLAPLWTTGVKVMLIVVSASLLGQVALVTWGPSTAEEEAGASAVAVGVLVAAGIAAGNWLGTAIGLSARGDAIVAVSPVLTGALLCAFALAGGSEEVRLLAVFLSVTASLLNFPPGMARVFSEAPTSMLPLATAVINQAGWLASAVGPIVLGLAATGSGPPAAAWIVLGGVIIMSGLAALAINRQGEQRAAPVSSTVT